MRPLRAAWARLVLPAAVAAALPLHGCAPPRWQPVATAPARRLPPGQLVRVWHDGASHTLRAVALTADSLSGVPWQHDPACERCRVAFPLVALDSVRTGRSDLRGVGAAAGVAVGLAVYVVVVFLAWRGD